MRRKHISFLKRSISSVLTVSMLLSMIQVPVSAARNKDVYLPENEMEQDILSSDVFYLATASAQLREGAGERYLLRLARGGDASTAAGVTVKISDLTAKYGRDYTISILDSKEKVLFTLAAYNAGEGRIADCRNLASARGLDSNKWEEVVQVIPEMRLDSIYKEDCVRLGKFQGHETIDYVDKILNIYSSFCAVCPA